MAGTRDSPSALNPGTSSSGWGTGPLREAARPGQGVRGTGPDQDRRDRQRKPGLWCWRGDPGSGKSALLRYLQGELTDWRALVASGVESETELAYSGLHQLCAPLLDGHLDRLPDPQRDALATALGHDLCRRTPGPVPCRACHPVLGRRRRRAATRWPVSSTMASGSTARQAKCSPSSHADCLAEPVALICATRTGQDDDVLAGLPELAVHGLSDRDARALLLSSIHGADGLRDRRPDRHREPRQPSRPSRARPGPGRRATSPEGTASPTPPRPPTRSSGATSAASSCSRPRPSCSP